MYCTSVGIIFHVLVGLGKKCSEGKRREPLFCISLILDRQLGIGTTFDLFLHDASFIFFSLVYEHARHPCENVFFVWFSKCDKEGHTHTHLVNMHQAVFHFTFFLFLRRCIHSGSSEVSDR